MNRCTLEWVERMNDLHGIQPGAVLEVGSRDYNGSPRSLFAGSEYVGVDIDAGNGVDLVMSAYELSEHFQRMRFGTVLLLNVLEHLGTPWVALAEIGKVISVGGYLYVSAPSFGYPLHDCPGDYWRVSEQTVRKVFMAGYDIISLEHAKTQWGKYPVIHCLGVKCPT